MRRRYDNRNWTGRSKPVDALIPIIAIILGGIGFLAVGLIVS